MFQSQWQGIEEGCLLSYEWLKKDKVGKLTQSVDIVSASEMEDFKRGEILECITEIEAVGVVDQTSFGGKTLCG